MSKFCGNCGTQLPDDANVCGNCGCNVSQMAAPAASAAPVQNSTPGDNFVSNVKDKSNAFIGKMKSDKKFMTMVIAIAGGAVTLLAVLIILLCTLGSSYEDAIDNYIDASFHGDYDAYLACYPDAYWDENDAEDEDDYEDAYELTLAFLEEEYGEDISVSYDVIDEDEYDEDDLSDLKSSLKSRWGVAQKDITAAYEIEIELTIEGDDDEDTRETTLVVAEVDGDWYVVQ